MEKRVFIYSLFLYLQTMYGYEEYTKLSPEQVLQKISQEQIFGLVFGHPINVDEHYQSPFREDNNPNCWFEWYEGKLLFMDFGDVTRHRSCFKAVMDKYNVTLHSAIKIICKHFNLSDDVMDYTPVEIAQKTIVHSEKARAIIDFTPRPFKKLDMKYWSMFLITEDNLKEDNISAVERFSIINKGRTKIITPFNLCYAYPFFPKVKLYLPNNNPDFRWITNCDENDIGNIKNLSSSGRQLIITKSYKDHRVLKNVGLGDVVWFQNETCIPDKSICTDLINRFENIIFLYDNDKQGILGSEKLVGLFNTVRANCAKSVHLPTRKYKWKDPADFIRREGRQDLIKVLKKIGVNGKNT